MKRGGKRLPTAVSTSRAQLDGAKPHEQLARKALPILIRQAIAGQRLTYGALAQELGITNPRTLGYPLGVIGNALIALGNEWGEEVPPLQSLVVRKSSGLPGEGIAWFAPDTKEFKAADRLRKRAIVDQMLVRIRAFGKWPRVLEHFELEPPQGKLVKFAPSGRRAKYGSGGESPDHRKLKEYVAENPQVVGLPRSASAGDTEYQFASADAVDVLFRHAGRWTGCEVKSRRSALEDLQRGIYQCVKYDRLIWATQVARQVVPDHHVVLVLEGSFPDELAWLRNALGVEVIDRVRVA